METVSTKPEALRPLVKRFGKIAAAFAFAMLVCGLAAGSAHADRHGHYHGGHHAYYHGHAHYYGGPDYYYAPPPDYYASPEPYSYGYYGEPAPPPPPSGINLFFGHL
jgi:hypothetical protein